LRFDSFAARVLESSGSAPLRAGGWRTASVMSQGDQLPEGVPRTIGRYQVQGVLGYGAMGAVYRAFDPLIKRTLAIKTIRLDIPRGSPEYKTFIERFYHEARISGTLSHPSIVTLFDIGEDALGAPFLAMEFVEGETLDKVISRGERFPPEKVVALVSQICSALDYAHARGIVHRDVKPSNLILSEGDRVKVTDFGIAKLAGAELTQQGQLLGTPSYMSPEQAMGEKLDGRSDIFSLGVVAFEMLSGEQPFPGNNVTAILYKLVHVDPIEPANLEMHGLIPERWHQVFGKVLAKRPEDRYQSAAEFVRDLELCLGSWFSGLPENAVESTVVLPAGSGAAAPAESTQPMERVDVEPTQVATTRTPRPGLETLPRRPEGLGAETVPPPPASPSDEQESVPTVLVRASDLPASLRGQPAPPEGESGPTVVIRRDAPPGSGGDAGEEAGPTVIVRAADLEALSKPRPPASSGHPAQPRATTPLERPAPPVPPQPPRVPAPQQPVPPPLPPPLPPPAAQRPVPPTHGRPRGLGPALLAGGALLLLLSVAGLAYWLWPKAGPAVTTADVTPTPTPTATPTPVPVTATMSVATQPDGARVFLNGEDRGTAPLDLAGLEPGLYEVRAELDGYEPASEAVAVSAEAPLVEVRLELSRTRVAPTTGRADFTSRPAGAAILLDGAPIGATPLKGHRLKPGTYDVELRLEGYDPFRSKLVIVAGRRGGVEATLTPRVTPTPTATPTPTPDPNRIYRESEVDKRPQQTGGERISAQPRLRSGESVSVTLSFVVDENGEVRDVKIEESGGEELDAAHLAAVRTWRFTPGESKGVKVKVRLVRKYTYRAG